MNALEKEFGIRKRAVIVVDDPSGENPVYVLNMPTPSEDGFYRQTTSFNAFFYSCKKRNTRPDNILYMAEDWPEFERRQKTCAKYGYHYEVTETFDSIWEFYKFIGYDYKKKKYVSR